MKETITILTHNDLDAVGCLINIEFALPTIQKEIISTNYRDLEDKVQETIEYLQTSNTKLLIVCDVSFGNNKNLLLNVHDVCKTLNIKLLFLDHHMYPEGYFDNFEYINYVHNTEKSATLITHEFFKNQGKLKSLDYITNLINTYDIWLIENENFLDALDLNDFFWENYGMVNLAEKIIYDGYNLPIEYRITKDSRRDNIYKEIQVLKDKNLIHTAGNITIAFTDKYYDFILYQEFMEKNIDHLILASSYGIIRIRHNNKSNLKDNIKKQIREKLKSTDIGHLHAYPIQLKDKTFDTTMDKIKEIVSIINNTK